MENLQINRTNSSPAFDFNYEKGELEISGRSYPENASDIYEPALRWLKEYAQHPKPLTTVNFTLEYFNTSSSKIILEILRQLKTLHIAGNTVVVKWHYEEFDSKLMEEGELFAELARLPIELIALKEDVSAEGHKTDVIRFN